MENGVDKEYVRTYVEKCSVHFDDLDPFGMLYAGRYYPLVERGINARVARMGFPVGHEDCNVVVREFKLTFATPIRRVGEVELEFWLPRISRTSATFEFVVRSDDGEHARGHRSITKVDPATQRSTAWTDEIRAAFAGEPVYQNAAVAST